jgi:hypothetical protein
LATLARNIEWALDDRVQVFPLRKLSRLDREFQRVRAGRAHPALRHDRVVSWGTRLRRWLGGLDVLITVERPAPRLCGYCREVGVRSVVVALPDWLPADPSERVAQLAGADACVLYGAATSRQLRSEGLTNVVSLPLAFDAPLEKARPSGEEVTVYFNIGVGGPVDRRQVRLVLETMRELLPRHDALRLSIKMHPRARRSVGAIEPFHPHMRVVDREVSAEEMRALQREADVTRCWLRMHHR